MEKEARPGYLTSEEIKTIIKLAWELVKDNKLALAYDQFEKVLNVNNPSNPEALYGIGIIFRKRKRYREAKTCFNKAYQNDRGNPLYLREYGNACGEMRWYSEAIKAWEKCLEKEKNDISLLVKIAEAYGSLGNFVMAKKYFFTAYGIDPQNRLVLKGLCLLYFHNNLYTNAVYYCENYLKKEPENIHILNNLGYCFLKRKKYGKTLEYYKRVLSIDTGNKDALHGLEQVYKKLNRDRGILCRNNCV